MSLKYAALGLLAERSLTGYDLKQAIDDSGVWSADQSQIYRTLSGLVGQGLAIRRTVVQTDRPSQHPHEITEAGLRELDRWLTSDPEPLPGVRDSLLVRLWFLARQDSGAVLRTLAARRAELTALEAELTREPWPRGTELETALRYAARAHRLAHVRAELAWLAAAVELVTRLNVESGTRKESTDG